MKILNRDNAILRKISADVPLEDIDSKSIKNIISKMKLALNKEKDGVAIAAPQIGENLRIFVISSRAFSIKQKDEGKEKLTGNISSEVDQVYINPKILKSSKRKKKMEEGCLSIRWLYGEVERSEKVTISAIDENGNNFIRGSSGLIAQIFQHEIDHLDGILFTDKAENLVDIPPKKSNEVF